MNFFNVRYFLITLIVTASIQTSYAQISQEESPALRVTSSTRYSAITTHREYQQRVHKDFNRHDFKKAFDGYSLLAMYNDKVAQYRLAFMYNHGLGVEKDLVKAYAWAQLSKESQPIDQDEYQEVYVNLYKHISTQLDEPQRKQAELLATHYHSKYSFSAVAQRARNFIRKAKIKCRGSLLGICSRASRTVVGNFSDSGNPSCDIISNSKPGVACLTYASIGLADINGLSSSDINKHIHRLDEIIERYNPGRVELRELELIDDTTITERS